MAMGDRFYSVEVPIGNVFDCDGDEDGPIFTIFREVRDWAYHNDVELDWSFDDMGNPWFEFDHKGVAASFLLTFS